MGTLTYHSLSFRSSAWVYNPYKSIHFIYVPTSSWFLTILDLYALSVALVRKPTIPTEWPPPVGEVSANFSG